MPLMWWDVMKTSQVPQEPELPSGQGGSQEPWAEAFFQLTSLGLELESL